MAEPDSNLVLVMLREMREENARFRAETKKEIGELKNLIGGQGVILTAIAGYIHQVEERVEALKGKSE